MWLTLAIERGSLPILLLLLQYRADPRLNELEGISPLQLAQQLLQGAERHAADPSDSFRRVRLRYTQAQDEAEVERLRAVVTAIEEALLGTSPSLEESLLSPHGRLDSLI